MGDRGLDICMFLHTHKYVYFRIKQNVSSYLYVLQFLLQELECYQPTLASSPVPKSQSMLMSQARNWWPTHQRQDSSIYTDVDLFRECARVGPP